MNTTTHNGGSLTRLVRAITHWACAVIVLPPVALIYVPSCVLAELFTTTARLADSIGKRFDDYWDSGSNEQSHTAPTTTP